MVPFVLRLNKPLAQVALNSSSVSALYYQTTSDFCSFSFVFLFQGLFLKEDYVTGPLPFQEKQTRSFAGRMRQRNNASQTELCGGGRVCPGLARLGAVAALKVTARCCTRWRLRRRSRATPAAPTRPKQRGKSSAKPRS